MLLVRELPVLPQVCGLSKWYSSAAERATHIMALLCSRSRRGILKLDTAAFAHGKCQRTPRATCAWRERKPSVGVERRPSDMIPSEGTLLRTRASQVSDESTVQHWRRRSLSGICRLDERGQEGGA